MARENKEATMGTHGGPGSRRKISGFVGNQAEKPDPQSNRSKRRASRGFAGDHKHLRRAKARLDLRVKAFESPELKGGPRHEAHKPGSLKLS